MTDIERASVLNTLRSNLLIDPSIVLQITSDNVANEQCFRKIAIQGRSSIRTWSLNVFLSPDHRYISSDLFQLNSKVPLGEGAFVPQLGSPSAPVTIIVFSDFQCATCDAVTGMLESLLRKNRVDDLKIEYRNLPLSNDSWAFKAAEAAACAEIQGQDAFWAMRNRIFADQKNVTAANLRNKLLGYAQEVHSLKKEDFEACIDGEGSLGLVHRDMDIAAKYAVHGTPTVLVNSKIVIPPTEQRIQKAIERERKNLNNLSTSSPESPNS